MRLIKWTDLHSHLPTALEGGHYPIDLSTKTVD